MPERAGVLDDTDHHAEYDNEDRHDRNGQNGAIPQFKNASHGVSPVLPFSLIF